MARKKLTDLYVKRARAPASGRLTVTDTVVSGLSFRVTAKSAKSFLIRYRPKGQPQRYYTVAGDSLAYARQRARDILVAAKRGVDLIAEEQRATEEKDRQTRERAKAKESERTVRELAAEYIDKYCKAEQRRWRHTELRLDNHVVPVIGEKMASEVRRADIVELLDTIAKKGFRHQVNRTRTSLSGMFRFAVEREYVTENPVIGTSARKVESERSRVLTDNELAAIWSALENMLEPGRSFVRTLLLTAVRRDEARCMRWSEIDLAGALWVLPKERNKSERDFEIPLSKPMLALLENMPRHGPCAFTVHPKGEVPWAGHGTFKPNLDEKSGVTGWVLHDLRRTVRSRLAELRVPYEVAERVLNHAMTKIERTYNRYAYREQKAAALQAWADRLMLIVGATGADNVEVLRARA